VKLTKCQNHHHHGVYLAHRPSGPNPGPNGPRGRPAGPTPWLASRPNSLAGWPGLKPFWPMASWTCLHLKRKAMAVEKGSGGRSTRPAGHVARPAGQHLVSYRLSQVGGAPPQPYKYPPPVEIRIHTPLHENSTCKALILSVVARRCLVGRVVRL
jgi:hypothetical protein